MLKLTSRSGEPLLLFSCRFLFSYVVIAVRIMYFNRALIKHNVFKGLYYGSFHSFRGPTSDAIVSVVFVYKEL